MAVAISVIIPFALAVVAKPFTLRLRNVSSPHLQTGIVALIVAGLFGVFASYLPLVQDDPIIFVIDWVPQIGLSLSLYLDSLALLYALLITGIGVAIVIFAGYYFDEVEELGRFYSLMLAFMGSMLGLVLSGNILTLFICWELTSVISFNLISFKGKYADARKSALRALMITAGGGLALLAGLLLLGVAGGSYEFNELLSNGDVLRAHPWYAAFTILILIGCFSKSAQFPLHFWLPGAMTAPTPASAYLHSATMVKAGIYLLLRFSPALGDTALWVTAVSGIGFFTFLLGSAVALAKTDLKAILAYATVSKLGAIVALIGLPEGIGIKAALVGILAHALYKATLFMVAGSLDHATGTRDYRRFGGLAKTFPWLAGLTVVAGLSMAGAPLPLLGFVSKETLIDASLQVSLVATVVTVIASALTVTVALILIWDVFFGEARDESLHPHALPKPIAVGPVLISIGTVVFALAIPQLVIPLITPIVPKEFSLYLIPRASTLPAFGLSILALVAGGGVFAGRHIWRGWKIPFPDPFEVYDKTIRTVEWFGDALLQTQGGKLRYYLVVILMSVALFMTVAAAATVAPSNSLTLADLQLSSGNDVVKLVLLGITLAAAIGTIVIKEHFLAALSLGVMGYAVGGVFLVEPAPDVALVHFLVETMATVLVIVMLGRISAKQRKKAMNRLWGQTRRGIARDIVISTVIGAVVSAFAVAAVLNRPERTSVATWHLDNSFEATGATDVVAAILADFRGTDTLLEIAVFSMAAVGVLTLLSTFHSEHRSERESPNPLVVAHTHSHDDNPHEEEARLSTPFTRVIARMLMPFALLIAFSHVLFGASAPGDGFSAGIVAGLALGLWYVVFGYSRARDQLRWVSPGRLIGIGLFIAILNALAPMVIGLPFFAHLPFESVSLPANIKFASSTIFEIAIFLTIFGSSGTILEAIAHPTEVEPI